MTHPAPYPAFALPKRQMALSVNDSAPSETGAVGHIMFTGEQPPTEAALSADRAAQAGFTAKAGSSLVLPVGDGPLVVLVGAGARDDADAAAIRDAAAVFARAVTKQSELALVLPELAISDQDAATAALEGAALARYTYRIGEDAPDAKLTAFSIVADGARHEAIQAGLARGETLVKATKLARDLAGTPGGMLTAPRFGRLAQEVGTEAGLEVEVFDEEALVELGCGGLLGVNLGSHEPPVMVKLVYRPEGEPTGRLTLVGKGIMYDSGGLALKPGDEVHATMKNDMTGAAAVLASMTTLRDLGCQAQVTGYLMCTDNLPDATSVKLGDVIVMRGGKTVEVINSDAEGRLVMADALVLATEEPVDAIVDIATLTGACLRALGPEIAGLMGNDAGIIEQVRAAGERVDEPVWELPLARRYRKQLDSTIADLRNVGGVNAGAITAALFLAEFVGDVPWAHLDIAGTAQSDSADKWINKGTTGSGTRLLIDLAMNFTA